MEEIKEYQLAEEPMIENQMADGHHIQQLTRDDLIRVAKRENNTKRNFLYVNPLQGKHLPVSPSLALSVFEALAGKVAARCKDEKLLLIGFAETATAIGAAMSADLPGAVCYLHTTREAMPGVQFLVFSESHSHATLQQVALSELENYLAQADRIVFAEDEVTTGNTIEKLIHLLRGAFPQTARRFGIASLLNSMSEERIRAMEEEGIWCEYLFRIPPGYRTGEIENCQCLPLRRDFYQPSGLPVRRLSLGGNCWNGRLAAPVGEIRSRCKAFAERALEQLLTDGLLPAGTVLILGTEECMYPGLLLGAEMEKAFPQAGIRFHATTRSPLEVSAQEDYPLHERYPMESLYEDGRPVFLYNLEKYDLVVIVTDAPEIYRADPQRAEQEMKVGSREQEMQAGGLNPRGFDSLIGAIEAAGNETIVMIDWTGADDAKQL